MFNPNDHQSLEKYSSAVTLSDMEIFIFPELLYSLVLANIMSPALWQWRNHPWFAGIDTMPPHRRILRLKQFIMDNYAFNLDLDTWGLTTKQRELSRFNAFVDADALAQSNALFGYEGDKYYFDVDIRKHFGLDKYTEETIPYWKTETIEAMNAFRFKPGYTTGAGECVSLSTLYAAALFVVARIPLEQIYLLATPLHSQNFVDVKDGVITNNRRIVTKTMWFNGTEVSDKARRALENERVTVIANNSGHIHILYPDATIDRKSYDMVTTKLRSFLKTDITFEIVANFLRSRSALQKCFQISHFRGGKPRYIEAEKVYAYEHNSKARVGDPSQEQIVSEIDEDEFYPTPLPNRIMLSEIQAFFEKNPLSVDSAVNVAKLKEHLLHTCFNVETVVADIIKFCRTMPRLPDPAGKRWIASETIDISDAANPADVVRRLEELRNRNTIADLAFTAFRDLSRSSWKPFLKAAFERSPVCIEGSARLADAGVMEKLAALPNDSIYDGARLAQPDEVWNYGRGDGLEKAICLMNILAKRHPGTVSLDTSSFPLCVVQSGEDRFQFTTAKPVPPPKSEDFT